MKPPGPPPARSYPAELQITVEGKELARTTVAEPAALLTEIATVFRTSQVSREYRQLAKLLPSDHDSRLRVFQRRAGSLLATPTMRGQLSGTCSTLTTVPMPHSGRCVCRTRSPNDNVVSDILISKSSRRPPDGASNAPIYRSAVATPWDPASS